MFDIFSLPEAKMPDGFLWGSGYAGHQVEGNNIYSQNWEKEHAKITWKNPAWRAMATSFGKETYKKITNK